MKFRAMCYDAVSLTDQMCISHPQVLYTIESYHMTSYDLYLLTNLPDLWPLTNILSSVPPSYITIFLNTQLRVDRINDKYGDGHAVVYFEERKEKDMRLAQRLAFFAASDILMITPTRSLSMTVLWCAWKVSTRMIVNNRLGSTSLTETVENEW